MILTGDFNAKLEVNKGEIKQKLSRNGKYLQELIDVMEMEPISLKSTEGTWSRENRKNKNEKSIIDYILTTKPITKNVTQNIVDEKGTYRISGKVESDHNTMLISVKTNIKKEKEKITRLKLNNKEGWKQYNTQINEIINNCKPVTQGELQAVIRKTIKSTVGETTIELGKNRRKEPSEIKLIRQKIKEARKSFNLSIKNKRDNLSEKLDTVMQLQTQLRKEIEKNNKERINAQLKHLIINGPRSKEFWKARKQTLGGSKREHYDTMDESGNIIKDPEKAKEHIANYFENLYQAREGKVEYQEWTNKIQKEVKDIEQKLKTEPPVKEISKEELNLT